MSFLTPNLKLLAISQPDLRWGSLNRGWQETLSIAETACGGLMGATILSVPGTSKCFRGSLAAYSLDSRIAFLGWTEENSKNYKGPDEQVVIGLASHLRNTLSTTWCLSESGVCGPTRPEVYRQDIEGPGYCAYAVVRDGGKAVSKEVRVPQPKSREDNMEAMAEEGLKFLLDTLKAQEASNKM